MWFSRSKAILVAAIIPLFIGGFVVMHAKPSQKTSTLLSHLTSYTIPCNSTAATSNNNKEVTNSLVVDGVTYILPSDIRFILPWSDISVPANTNNTLAERVYKRLIDRKHVDCQQRTRVGSTFDGGWDFCLAGPYKPQRDCLVYDFGIAKKWSFDDALVERFHCSIRAFDPTNGLSEHKRGKNIDFYPIGLFGSDQIMQIGQTTDAMVRTLETLVNKFGDQQRIIDFLKIDIEQSEWSALPSMLSYDFMKTNVKQLGLEVHHYRNSNMTEKVDLLNKLEKMGFKKWHTSWNHAGIYPLEPRRYFTKCSEIYYINIHFLKKREIDELFD